MKANRGTKICTVTTHITRCAQCGFSRKTGRGYLCRKLGRETYDSIAEYTFPDWCPLPYMNEVQQFRDVLEDKLREEIENG